MNWKAEQILEQAIVAVRGRDYDRALALCQAAIHEDNVLVEAWTLRGNILLAQERLFDAALHYERAINLRHNAADAMNNMGQALANMGQWGNAELAFRDSIATRESREPHMGLANMFCTLMRLEEGAAEYAHVVAADPTDHEAAFNLGVTLLGMGQWREGFVHYHRRHGNNEFPPAARRLYPEWTGQDLTGKTILLYPEQGYGDEIMAARFADVIRDGGKTGVVLEARAPFSRLAKELYSPAGIEIVTRGDHYPKDIDYSCSAMDVPMWLDLTPPKVTTDEYLCAPYAWRRPLPPGFNVGLCWGSGKHLSAAIAARSMKSIPVHKLAGLAMPGVNLISLQKPAEPSPPEMGIIDWTEELHDLADTAALIAELDLVITVDTAVAHLAGAMGKPVWNFVRFSGYWPWLSPQAAGDPHKSIWYPSMQLLRQPTLNDWGPCINQAVANVRALVEARQHEEAAE
jgi:Tfp pilus assembly protein PilF